jgi:hypothetical protein
MMGGTTNATRESRQAGRPRAAAGPEDDEGDTVIDGAGLQDGPVDVEIEIAPDLPLDIDVSANE